MTEPWAFVDGDFIPFSQMALPLDDAGVVFGVIVTDLARTFGNRLYRWPEHLARFRASCRAVHVEPRFDDDVLTGTAHELIRRNARAGGEQCLVVYATPGRLGHFRGAGGIGPATTGMHTYPLPWDRYRDLVERGAVLRVPGVRQLPATSVPPTVKARSRLHWWLADHEVAASDPAAKALLLDATGHVTETAIANFLTVRGDRVMSPRRGSVLLGISLGVVRDLCSSVGLVFEERDLTLAECLDGDEALLTGTAFSIAGVRQLDDRTYPFPGRAFVRLAEAWSREVGADIYGGLRP
ncbi:MAG TPA: aminotransferase class IV [Gemmataceae bacterium]|jgi:branched-chain amino acid aminotransferase|nr:aminotransferase class IV [Gemmataceae bacterium]